MLPLRRFASLLLDIIAVAACAGLGAALSLLSNDRGYGGLAWMFVLTYTFGAAAILAQLVLVVRWRRTLGQRALGLRLVGDAGQPGRGRALVRIVLLILMPTVVVLAAHSLTEGAKRQVENWGATHPDWQRRLDDARARREDIHDRLEASGDVDERERLSLAQDEAEAPISAIVMERDQSMPGRIGGQADNLTAGTILLWLLVNGTMLFTQRGPLHDRLCRVRVERA